MTIKTFKKVFFTLIFGFALIYPFLITDQGEIKISGVYGQSSACDQAQGVGVCHYFGRVGGNINWGYEASQGRGVLWREIEPSDDNFDFHLLDNFINNDVPADTKAWLAIQTVDSGSNGVRKAPLWLDGAGANWFPCTLGGIDHGIYAPWDEKYQEELDELLHALNNHLHSKPSAYLDKIGGIVMMSGGMYGEMNLWSGNNCAEGNLKDRLKQDMQTKLGITISNEAFDQNYANAISQIVDIYAADTGLPLMLQLAYQPVDCWVAIEKVKTYGNRISVKFNGLDPSNVGDGKDTVRENQNGYYQELFLNLSEITQVGYEIGHPNLFTSQAQFENVFAWAESSRASFVCFQYDLIPALQAVPSWTAFDSTLESTPCSFGGSIKDECPDGSFWIPDIYTGQPGLFSPIPGISIEEILYAQDSLECEDMYEVESRDGHPYKINPPVSIKNNPNTSEPYHLYDNAYEAPIGRATDKVEFIAEEVVEHLDAFPGLITQEINQANQLINLTGQCSIDYCRGDCVGGSTAECFGGCSTCDCATGLYECDCSVSPCGAGYEGYSQCYCCNVTSGCSAQTPPCLTKDDPAVYGYDYRADCVDYLNCACPQDEINTKLAQVKNTAWGIMWERFKMQRFFTGRYLPADLYHRQYGLNSIYNLNLYVDMSSIAWVTDMLNVINREKQATGHSYAFDESFDPLVWLVCFSDQAENCVPMLDLDVNKNLVKSRGVLGGCVVRSYEASEEAEEKRKRELLYSCQRLLSRINPIHAFVEPVIDTPPPLLEYIIPQPPGIPQEDVCYGNDYCQLRYEKYLEYPSNQDPPEEWPCAEDYYCCQ